MTPAAATCRRGSGPQGAAGSRTLWPAALAVLLGLVAGCGRTGTPRFEVNLEGRDPASVSPAQREAIEKTLTKLFGTPDQPKVPAGVPLDLPLLEAAAGPIGGDHQGRRRGLYRQHCVTCHGIAGDGAGPAAAMLTPYPRDFRRGTFKYTSTLSGAKPSRDDLLRVLMRGVAGTAMPSHALLPPEEIDALIEYVRYLSLRGQTEQYLLQLVVDEDERLPLDLTSVIDDGVLPIARQWAEAETLVVAPPPADFDTPEKLAASVALGAKLYAQPELQCVKCHGPDGNGEGEEKELYDDWNKPKKGINAQQTRQLAGRYTLPLQVLRPRNFREGVFRGGNGPNDLYWRIYVGIKGTPMPPAGPAPGSAGVLSPEDTWHVVNYIRSLGKK